jgi:hypothetical protein
MQLFRNCPVKIDSFSCRHIISIAAKKGTSDGYLSLPRVLNCLRVKLFIYCDCVQVSEALKFLRSRSRHQEFSSPSWQRGITSAMTANGDLAPGDGNLSSPPEAGTSIGDIATLSRKHARAMVAAAVKV